VELVGVCSNAALMMGVLVQDMHTQYHQTSPWITIQEGRLTGTSSIMPQKRNPYALNVLAPAGQRSGGRRLHLPAGGAQRHARHARLQTRPGRKTLDLTTNAFVKLADLMNNLVIDRNRALQEVDADYSTTTELADILQRDSDVPFRVGHHFASDLVNYGRANKLKPADIPFDVSSSCTSRRSRPSISRRRNSR
jgi:argininosuccinate lyase